MNIEKSIQLLAEHDHGILGTVRPSGESHLVPVVYSYVNNFVVIPVDTVKKKATAELARFRHLDGNPHASLLIEHWDHDDWSRLWWVRADLHADTSPDGEILALGARRLSSSFSQYADTPFSSLHVFEVSRVVGWTASDP